MRNRRSLISCCDRERTATFIKIQKKFPQIERRSIAKCLAWDYENYAKTAMWRWVETDAHGGSLAVRLKFHSFHVLWPFNQLHRLPCVAANEMWNKSRMKSSKSAPEHEEADSAYHQQISEHAIDQLFSLFCCFAVRISTADWVRGDNCMRIHKVLKCTSPPLRISIAKLSREPSRPAKGQSNSLHYGFHFTYEYLLSIFLPSTGLGFHFSSFARRCINISNLQHCFAPSLSCEEIFIEKSTGEGLKAGSGLNRACTACRKKESKLV